MIANIATGKLFPHKLGYELSDEERALKMGTHDLFKEAQDS